MSEWLKNFARLFLFILKNFEYVVLKKYHKNIAEEKNYYICTINNAEENKLEHKRKNNYEKNVFSNRCSGDDE